MIYSTDVEKKIITIYEDKRCIMKKRIVMLMTGIMSAAMLLTACEASKGLETDRLKITQYKGVEVEQVEKPKEISDEDVESRIQMMLEGQAETKEITDRAVQGGDTVNIDYVGKIGGKEFEGGSAKGYDLEIGSGNFIEGFEDSIIGHKIGETFDWNGKFPDNYGNTEYAGKDVVFTITVNGITERNVPELDDKIVAKLSENAKTVKEYKEEVKKQIRFMKEYRLLLQFGTFYRLSSPFEHNMTAWMTVSEDQKVALVGWYRMMNRVNAPYARIRLKGLAPELYYEDASAGRGYYGDELMNLGLLTSDSSSGEVIGDIKPGCDFDSRIYVLKAV